MSAPKMSAAQLENSERVMQATVSYMQSMQSILAASIAKSGLEMPEKPSESSNILTTNFVLTEKPESSFLTNKKDLVISNFLTNKETTSISGPMAAEGEKFLKGELNSDYIAIVENVELRVKSPGCSALDVTFTHLSQGLDSVPLKLPVRGTDYGADGWATVRYKMPETDPKNQAYLETLTLKYATYLQNKGMLEGDVEYLKKNELASVTLTSPITDMHLAIIEQDTVPSQGGVHILTKAQLEESMSSLKAMMKPVLVLSPKGGAIEIRPLRAVDNDGKAINNGKLTFANPLSKVAAKLADPKVDMEFTCTTSFYILDIKAPVAAAPAK